MFYNIAHSHYRKKWAHVGVTVLHPALIEPLSMTRFPDSLPSHYLFTVWSYVVVMAREGNEEWSTHLGTSHTHVHLTVYPNFVSKRNTEVFEDGEEEYVHKVAQHARDKGFQCIDCSCGASIPSSRGHERDILHCHPSFHSYPYLKRTWHDWVMVKWLIPDGQIEEYVLVAACLLLFARLSSNEDDSIPPTIVVVIHSLTEYVPPNDKLLFFAKGDSLDPNGIDVVEATAIEGTAFVLPCVENPGDDFPTSQETASYFLVFPPRSEWIHNW